MQKGQTSEEISGRPSKVLARNFIINRGDTNSGPRTSAVYSSRSSMGGSTAPGVYKAISSTGVNNFKGSREKEKRELQDLNVRLANFIDKVHFLETRITELEAENLALRNRKVQDLKPIRDAYENELAQARKVIDDLSSNKGVSEAKLVGLQDEVEGLRSLINTLESQAKDYKKKIESQNHSIGELEGEVGTLRLRVGSLEDENAKLRELMDKLQEQLRRLRSDLDAETAAHIESDCLAQTKTEEAQFYKDLLAEMELMKPEPVTIKGMSNADFWKAETAKCIRDITAAYEDKLQLVQDDVDAKYAAQLNSLRNGNVKDTMQLAHAQEEIKRLRGQLNDNKGLLSELQSKVVSLQSERDDLAKRLADLERELESERLNHSQQVSQLSDELESCIAELRLLMDAKMSMEMEIACYQKLLEGEESRVGIRGLVEQTMGVQSRGGSALADVIQQSNLHEASGSLTVQRSSKGPVGFVGIDHSGKNLTIENTTSGARSRAQNLKGWKLQKLINGSVKIEINLKDHTLNAGDSFTVWATDGKKRSDRSDEQVTNERNFGVGTCTWKLIDESGNEKATLNAKFSG